MVAPETEESLKEFLENYEAGETGSFVAAFASILSLFDLFSPTDGLPDGISIAMGDSAEVVAVLSAPKTWSEAWRTLALNYLQNEVWAALQRNDSQGGHMFQHLRDVIRNPDRYENGGIQYDPERKGLTLRGLPGHTLHEFRGLRANFTSDDQAALAELLPEFRNVGGAALEYIMLADFIFELDPDTVLREITRRDLMLLNKALLLMYSQQKTAVRGRFMGYAASPDHTPALWKTLCEYLERESWHEGIPTSVLDDLP